MTLHPYHSDRLIMSRVAVSGLLTVLHAALDMEHTILDSSHYILYCIAVAIQPRMLITVDEELKPLPVSVRVGQAVGPHDLLRGLFSEGLTDPYVACRWRLWAKRADPSPSRASRHTRRQCS